jgi:tryptophan halogenase
MPEHYHPVAGVMSDEELRAFLANIKMRVDKTVAQLPGHRLYVEQYCAAALKRGAA